MSLISLPKRFPFRSFPALLFQEHSWLGGLVFCGREHALGLPYDGRCQVQRPTARVCPKSFLKNLVTPYFRVTTFVAALISRHSYTLSVFRLVFGFASVTPLPNPLISLCCQVIGSLLPELCRPAYFKTISTSALGKPMKPTSASGSHALTHIILRVAERMLRFPPRTCPWSRGHVPWVGRGTPQKLAI